MEELLGCSGFCTPSYFYVFSNVNNQPPPIFGCLQSFVNAINHICPLFIVISILYEIFLISILTIAVGLIKLIHDMGKRSEEDE